MWWGTILRRCETRKPRYHRFQSVASRRYHQNRVRHGPIPTGTMSPASLDVLEVERYVGACLFSQNNRTKGGFGGPSPQRWAGGAPLISFAGYHRPNRSQSREEANHLAQLAVHTHGAPLILTKYYHHRRNKGPKTGNNINNNNNNVVQQTKVFENSSSRKQNSKGVDSVSVTSDESSGSQNSETCLPRIIKPRKRRKKDRKPVPHHSHPQVFNDPYSNQDPLLTNLPPYFPYLEPFQPSQDVPNLRDSTLDFLDASEIPKLHHSFEEVEEGEDVNQPQASTCQCRYCDPEGQIWDVDRSCYSPFLTPPKSFDFSSLFPSSLSHTPSIFDNLQSQLAGLSLGEDKPAFSRSTSSSSTSSFSSTGDLEVSTEIVTSPNGHRDLEIKFWLSGNADSKSTNADKPG